MTTSADLEQEIENTVYKAMQAWNIPGLALAIVKEDKVLLAKGYGIREIGKPDKVDGHTLFAIASNTKTFTATAIGLLVQDRKIAWDDLVTKYIPELKGTAYDDATVRQVMDMTVGVQYSENYADPKAEVWDYARAGGMLPAGPSYQGPKTFYEFLVKLKREGNHDEAFGYKTVNAEILAWIVKRVSGKSLAALPDRPDVHSNLPKIGDHKKQ